MDIIIIIIIIVFTIWLYMLRRIRVATTDRLFHYIQDGCCLNGEPVDWYFVRSQTKSLKEADQICDDLIKYLNLTIEKNGEEYIPNMEA